MSVRVHTNCIIPPQLLEKLMAHKDERIRKRAFETLLFSERVRERRAILGPVMLAGGGLNRTIYDAQRAMALPGKRVRSEGGQKSGDASVDAAYDGLGATYKFFKNELGRDSLDGNGMRLDATVHFGEGYLNAFWNGSQMVFGDGDGQTFLDFTRSLDVIAHELTHGVTEFTSGLIYHNQPGALNESFSDVFGTLVKQYVKKQNVEEADWLIGNDIVGPEFPGPALRSMKDPGSAYDGDDQPKHMDDYQRLPDTRAGDWGGVHVNSGIPNFVFYSVATKLGGYAWEAAGRIWYEALQSLHPNSDFLDCANKTVEAAARLFEPGSEQERAVRTSWQDVGIQLGAPHKQNGGLEPQANARDLGKELQRHSREIKRIADALALH